MNINVIRDNTGHIKEEYKQAVERALERCGMQAESFAKNLSPVVTGLLKNSITHAVAGKPAAISSYSSDDGTITGHYSGSAPESSGNKKTVYIGTNVEYAIYVENGTHKQEAEPLLKPAVENHKQTYRNIIKDEINQVE